MNYSVSCQRNGDSGNKTIINGKICVIIRVITGRNVWSWRSSGNSWVEKNVLIFFFVNDGSQDNTSEVLRRAVELEPGRFLAG